MELSKKGEFSFLCITSEFYSYKIRIYILEYIVKCSKETLSFRRYNLMIICDEGGHHFECSAIYWAFLSVMTKIFYFLSGTQLPGSISVTLLSAIKLCPLIFFWKLTDKFSIHYFALTLLVSIKKKKHKNWRKTTFNFPRFTHGRLWGAQGSWL